MSNDNSSIDKQKLRQFGLYRTIDARTEDFLKLSKKKQIKQGCVCAAISTVITVTVVVSVILVYEYRFDRETNKTSWYGPMNKSNKVFEKHNKPKVHFDKTTVKLLPILLKAINNNSQLQKIIEDYSVPNASIEIKNFSGQPHNNVILSVGPTPTSKLIRGVLNILPMSLFKKTETDNFYIRMKKEKDYEKFSSYLENILNEKISVDVTPTSFMSKYLSTTEPIGKIKKIDYRNNMDENISKRTLLNILRDPNRKKTIRQRIHNCKCSTKITNLLKNFASTIEKFVPSIKNILMACNEDITKSNVPNKTKNIEHKLPVKAKSKSDYLNTSMLLKNGLATLIRKQIEEQKIVNNNSFALRINTSPKKVMNKNLSYEVTSKKYEIETLLTPTYQEQIIKTKSAKTYLIHGNKFEELPALFNNKNKSAETTTKLNGLSILQIFKNINNIAILNDSSLSHESGEIHNMNRVAKKRADKVLPNTVRKKYRKHDGFYVPQLRINYNTNTILTTKLETTTVNFYKISNKFLKKSNDLGSNRFGKYEVEKFDTNKNIDLSNDNSHYKHRNGNYFEKEKNKIHPKPTTIKPTHQLNMIRKKNHSSKQSGSVLRSAITMNNQYYLYDDDYYDFNS